jgi:hypothetical protein
MAIYSGPTTQDLNSAVKLTNAVILAGNNSVTITHNFGYQAKVLGVNGTDINASVFELLNQGVNSFDIAFQGGITQITNTGIAVTYV